MRKAPAVDVNEEDLKTLKRWSSSRCTPARLILRSHIVLLASEGQQNCDIAAHLGISRQTVGLWRTRFAKKGLTSIKKDAPRGRGSESRLELERKIIEKTTQEKRRDADRWSTRSLAEELGISRSTVQRAWRTHRLRPHLVKTFKLSTDPQFVEKLRDVVDLHLDPPEHSMVFSVDEKSQIQALDRTQPGLPIKRGRCATMTHDYKRNGTTTLFAAMDTASGRVISDCMPRHRHQEWIKFLNQINRETPKEVDIHLIADNYATHKHKKVKAWFKRHRRFHMHFIPTSSSWLNVVEGFFAQLTRKRLKHGIFPSVPVLVEVIEEFIRNHNVDPQPIVWVKRVEEIMEKVGRARVALEKAKAKA